MKKKIALLAKQVPSPSRLLSVMDPLLGTGVLLKVFSSFPFLFSFPLFLSSIPFLFSFPLFLSILTTQFYFDFSASTVTQVVLKTMILL